MRAYLASGTNRLVEIANVDDPDPAPNEARVRVTGFSVNRGELNQLRLAEPGWRPGWDVVGVVEAAANDGTGPEVGARVVGWTPGGAWSERVALRTDQLAVLPGDVADVLAAGMPVAGITARRILALGSGELRGLTVFVTGGAGGVGSFAICLASNAGAEVHASASNSARAAVARELGAKLVVQGIADAPDDYDVVLESAGGTHLAQAMAKVKPGGTVVTFGNSSRESTTLNIADFYRRTRASLVAFALVAADEPKDFGQDLRVLCALASQGVFERVNVTARPWSELPEVLRSLDRREVAGKVVVGTPGSWGSELSGGAWVPPVTSY